MKKRILNYLAYMDDLLNDPIEIDLEKEIKEHLIQIGFFQHERLIHLIVTVTFAILTILSFLYCLSHFDYFTLGLTFLLLVLLIPYISHYYLLENGVQKMYDQYDKMESLIKK